MLKVSKTRLRVGLGGAALVLAMASQAQAQDIESASEAAEGPKSAFDEIVVTATKKANAQNVQDVAIAVTAFGADQLENQHIRTLDNLSYSAPNVQLDDVGTAPGFANFSIRGLGINSSIPSIDPTVGVFVDGVYMGISAGILFDTFDLEGVEVLRGPQGLLFGRNVTGGAVVVRSSTPGNDLKVEGRVAVESGLNKIVSGVVSGPIIEDKLAAKLAVYYNDDDGYFTNQFNGNTDFGASETLIVRAALNFTPSDTVSIVGRYEHGRVRGDGAVVSNFGLFRRESFGISVDEEGETRNDWNQASVEINIDTAFGDGKITNIAAYRDYSGFVVSDIDSSPAFTFHADTLTRQNQFSNELRYAGTFGSVDVTTGLYYFEQDIDYIELRRLAGGALRISGGGKQAQTTFGAFVSTDWRLTDTLTLSGGVRYSWEKKRVQVQNLTGNLCDPIGTRTCSSYGFRDEQSWADPTFRVGLQWQPTSDTLAYAFFARGFRSGGYNFRNGNPAEAPGPFDAEKQNSYEIGLKQDFGSLLRLNVAAFHNTVYGLQREIILPVLPLGTTQVIRNSADLRLRGVEAEATLRIGDHLTLNGQLGYTDAQYTRIFFDLTGDRVIDAKDFALRPPRLSPWTYGVAANFAHDVRGGGEFGARLAYAHRDAAWSNDNNTGLLSAGDIVDANVSFETDNRRWKLSLYGNNLLNDQTEGNVSPLPFFAGSTFSSINKGRVLGAELIFRY
ncbi:TonB-dependent receptor [Blastomonas sp. AAP53]|uniref:TonB-dependent receptor n=1 Tax=Blastomonas sp. AAP53 TaxID=1248760 RepID=UPI0002FEA907|nr:TonB-dependent receptor [Blastomonas sp. AAP53]